MAANFFGNGVGGPVVGLDAQAQVFLTQNFQEQGLVFDPMLRALERFVAHAQSCRALLSPPPAAATPKIFHGYA
jgi:hypothetical protein